MSATMRAVDITGGKGHAEALHITAIPKPTPVDAQALVKVKAFGLNRMDLLQREGHYPLPPQAPSTLGVEFSGIIDSLAEGHECAFKVGDEVFGLAYGGAYAEYIAVSTHMLIHKPSELSWEECAGIPETWITALQATYLIGTFAPGKSILFHAGASAVSISGIQLALAGGASAVYATVRQDSKVAFCVDELGCTAAFNTTKGDWAAELLEKTNGKGVDVIIDFIGADTFQGNLNVAALDARVAHLGAMSGVKMDGKQVDIGPLLRKRVRIEGSTLRSRDETYQRNLRDMLVERVLPGLIEGRMKVFVEKVFPWEEVVQAHLLLESNKTKGKIICTIG